MLFGKIYIYILETNVFEKSIKIFQVVLIFHNNHSIEINHRGVAECLSIFVL